MSRFSLAGKTAFVTGGSRGIGRAIAIGLAEAGADVALSYREKADEAGMVVAEIEALGRRGLALKMDVADRSSVEAGGGSIVHIGSVSGQYGGPRTAHYAASKAGLISLAQVIARFGAQHNVRSNVIAAGLIASDMAGAALAAASVQKAAENILLKRLGTTQEVADAAVFLASDASAYITAQTLNVNGGLYF
jgi:NAD(P)-dependent dehydrogenase (short-subunit alcohol dehydrogenase family)